MSVNLCDEIDIEAIERINTMINNRTMLISDLRKLTNYQNFTGDWKEVIRNTTLQLMALMPYHSPGTEILECRIYNNIWTFLAPVIFILGTVGNFLSFSVLCRSSMTQISTYSYLAVLALVDEAVIITQLFREWTERLQGKSLADSDRIACKLVSVICQFSTYLSVWLIVALTVERALVITFPFKAKQLATPRRARLIILLTAIACLLIPLHSFETVDLTPSQTNIQNSSHSAASSNISYEVAASQVVKTEQVVQYKCELHNHFFRSVWMHVDAALYSYLPFGIITVLNVIILMGVYRARRSRLQMTLRYPTQQQSSGGLSSWQNNFSSSTQSSTEQRRGMLHHKATSNSAITSSNNQNNTSTGGSENMRQLTVLLLAISFLFLLFTTPIVVVKFILGSNSRDPQKESIYFKARLELVNCVAQMLMYLNHAMNFFLYCAMGNKFRQQLVSLFSCTHKYSTAKQNRYRSVVANQQKADMKLVANNEEGDKDAAQDEDQPQEKVVTSCRNTCVPNKPVTSSRELKYACSVLTPEIRSL